MSEPLDIEAVLDRLAAGLCDDPELMLDVRAELASHFEEALDEYASEGLSYEESVGRVLESFGPIAEVADGLVLANKKRVGSRGMVRLIAQRLLVPVAACIALVSGWHAWSRVTHLVSSYHYVQSELPPHPLSPQLWSPSSKMIADDPVSRLTEEQAFFFVGDPTRSSLAQQQRAIWEQSSDNRVFMGNYVSVLLKEAPRTGLGGYEAELKLVSAHEPENARFYYLIAGMYCARASETTGSDRRALFERGFDFYDQGHAAGYFRRYAMDMADVQLEVLGPVRRIEDQLDRYKQVALRPTLDSVVLSGLISASAEYGRLLCEAGRLDRAREVMGGWQDLIVAYSRDVVMLDDVSVLKVLSRRAQADLLPVYNDFELFDDASLLNEQTALIGALSFDVFQPPSDYIARFGGEIESRGTLFSMLLAPMVSKTPYPGILEHGRQAEHMFVRQLGVVIVLGVLMVLMVVGIISALRWRGFVRRSSVPNLLLPTLGQFGVWFGLGVVMPLLVAWGYAQSRFSSGEFSVLFVRERLVFELALFCSVVVLAVVWVSDWGIRRRCRELRIEVPAEGLSRFAGVVAVTLLALVGGGLILSSPDGVIASLYYLGSWLAVGVLGCWVLVRLFRSLVASSRWGAYYSAAARTTIPLYAVAIMVLGGAVVPVLERLELSHLQHEEPLNESRAGGFVNMETARLMGMRRHLHSELKIIFSKENHNGSGS